MRKKKMYIIIAVIVVVISTYFLMIGYFKSEAYFLSKLPKKHRDYPTLKNDLSTKNYTVIKLFIAARPKQICQDLQQNIV